MTQHDSIHALLNRKASTTAWQFAFTSSMYARSARISARHVALFTTGIIVFALTVEHNVWHA